MKECPFLDSCIFFNDTMPDMPNTSELLKRTCCRDPFREHARYRVAQVLGCEKVPGDLFPDEGARADALMEEEP